MFEKYVVTYRPTNQQGAPTSHTGLASKSLVLYYKVALPMN